MEWIYLVLVGGVSLIVGGLVGFIISEAMREDEFED